MSRNITIIMLLLLLTTNVVLAENYNLTANPEIGELTININYTTPTNINISLIEYCPVLQGIYIENATNGTIYIKKTDNSYEIEPTGANFSTATITITATYNATILKCPTWDYETKECINETYEYIQSVNEGETYYIRIYPEDPLFSEYTSEEGETFTTSTDWITRSNTTYNLTHNSTYLYLGSEMLTGTSTTNSVYSRILFQGVELGQNSIEPNNGNPIFDYTPIVVSGIFNLTQGENNFVTQYKTENPSYPAYIKQTRRALIEIEDYDRIVTQTIQEINLTTAYQNVIELSVTPNETSEHLLLVSGGYSSSSPVQSSYARILIDGNVIGTIKQEAKDSTDILRFFAMQIHTLNDTTHNITLQMKSDGTIGIGEVITMTTIKMLSEDDYHYSTYNETDIFNTSLADTWINTTNITFTPQYNGTYIITGAAYGRSSSTSNTINYQLLLNETVICDVVKEPKDITDIIPLGCIYQANLTTDNPVTIRTRFDSDDAIFTELLSPDIVAFYTTSCDENWQSYYENITTCQTNNTITQRKLYTDLNSCGTTFELPIDNGTIEENYCNYCDPDWQEITGGIYDCQSNSTKYIEYEDLNGCYEITLLIEDSPPIDNGTWTSCDYYTIEFNCTISDTPYLTKKIEYTCELPNSNYECVNMITYGFNDVQQVNPQKTERTQGGLINIQADVESRESFTVSNGLLNAYYTDKNLVASTPFIITTTCSDGNNTIKNQKQIIPEYKKLYNVPTKAIWIKDNTAELLIIAILLLLFIPLIGFIISKIKG